jgi:hypothetical protein
VVVVVIPLVLVAQVAVETLLTVKLALGSQTQAAVAVVAVELSPLATRAETAVRVL